MSRLVCMLSKNSKAGYSLVKLNSMSNGTILKASSVLFNNQLRCASNKPAETKVAAQAEQDKPQWERNDRYKIFYGFDATNEANDKGLAHVVTFLGIFGFILLPSFLIYFFPDYRTNDWCYREAHLELARRKAAGEPLINPDYVPADEIKLPSDEELGDMEIVI